MNEGLVRSLNTPWIPWLILLALSFSLAYIRYTDQKRFGLIIKSHFNGIVFREAVREETLFSSVTSRLLLLNSVFVGALLIGAIISFYTASLPSTTQLLYLIGAIAGYQVVKWILSSIVGWLGEVRSVQGDYKARNIFYVQTAGIFLLPFVVGYYFFPSYFQNIPLKAISIWLGIGMITVLYFIKLAQTVMQTTTIKISWYYIILYLCTLEILPLVVLFRLLVVEFRVFD